MQVPDVKALGIQLRRRRELLAMTQHQAAGLAGVSHRLWSEVERGERLNASVGTVLRMLQTMGLDVELVERVGLHAGSKGSEVAS